MDLHNKKKPRYLYLENKRKIRQKRKEEKNEEINLSCLEWLAFEEIKKTILFQLLLWFYYLVVAKSEEGQK